MTVQSVGDQARAFAMQTASSRIKTTLNTLTAELSSGEVADLGSRLQGNTQVLGGIESRLALLSQFQRNATEAATRAQGMQDALGAMHKVTEGLGQSLYLEASPLTSGLLSMRSGQAETDLNTVIGQLNGSAGQRYLFSGTNSDTPPLAPANAILDELTTVISGLTSAQDIAQAVSDWFDAPSGSGGFADIAYHGGAGGQKTPVGDDTSVALTTTALSPSIRDSLKGLATAAILDRSALAGDVQGGRELLRLAGRALLDSGPGLVAEMSHLGYAQQVISTAQAQDGASIATLQSARNTLREADPFATAAAITDAETKLQTLYSVIGRLSQLKLANFL